MTRRDALLVYLPNVLGAGDYRVYAVTSGVNFTQTSAGVQPRGALISCAGFRRRSYDLELQGATPWRELLQAVELPGLSQTGTYNIVVEATRTPCPFTGMLAAHDANITQSDAGAPWGYSAAFRSPATVMAQYGNEIINGHGAATSWNDRNNVNITRGRPVSPTSTEIPRDPVVIARSAITLTLPAMDEAMNGPIFDVGPNAVFDDFSNDLAIAPSAIQHNSEFGDNWAVNPLATIPGKWTFWGNLVQPADGESGRNTNTRGFQAFQRHGRLYTTFGDYAQCCAASAFFSSLETLPQELDDTKYAHSFFRVNSDASTRRYWVWLMCGASTREELVDPTTRMPRFRPLLDPGFHSPRGTAPNSFTGRNPSTRHGNEPASSTRYDKECVQFLQDGIAEPRWPASQSRERSASRLVLSLNPRGVAQGVVSYGSGPDWWQPNFPGYPTRTDASGNYAGPMMEPFDQINLLTHFDVFVRPDRLVVYVNGRQAICADISDRPLTMRYGLMMYGSFLYHSSAELSEAEDARAASYQYTLNTPIADTRAWDAVGHSEKIDIPPQLAFNAAMCKKPLSTAVR